MKFNDPKIQRQGRLHDIHCLGKRSAHTRQSKPEELSQNKHQGNKNGCPDNEINPILGGRFFGFHISRFSQK